MLLQTPWWQVYGAPSQNGGSWVWLHPWASTPKHLLGQAIVLLMDRLGAAKLWLTSHAVFGRFAFIFWKVAVSLGSGGTWEKAAFGGSCQTCRPPLPLQEVRHATCSQPAFLTWATSKVVCQEDIFMAKTQTAGIQDGSKATQRNSVLNTPLKKIVWESST